MLVTRTTAICNIGFRLIQACHKNDCISRYWRTSHFTLSQERMQFSTLPFVSFMLVTRATAIFNIRFRLIHACHKNVRNFHYLLSSHFCLSQERLQLSMVAYVSFLLVTRMTAIFNIGFRLISACHKNECYFQYCLSCH